MTNFSNFFMKVCRASLASAGASAAAIAAARAIGACLSFAFIYKALKAAFCDRKNRKSKKFSRRPIWTAGTGNRRRASRIDGGGILQRRRVRLHPCADRLQTSAGGRYRDIRPRADKYCFCARFAASDCVGTCNTSRRPLYARADI